MEKLAQDLMNGEFRCEQVTEKGMKIEVNGADVFFRLAKGQEKQYKICTFRYNGAIIHLEEVTGFDNLVSFLRVQVTKWKLEKIKCSNCGWEAHESNLIYHDGGEYLCEDCFIEHAIGEMEIQSDLEAR